MENSLELIKMANDEAERSRELLGETVNKVRALGDVLFPALGDQIKKIRESRMTATTEMTAIMNDLRAIRSFFLESDYEKEMSRLERFVKLCREIQMLKAEGVFDAVCDSAIRLAVMEKKDG